MPSKEPQYDVGIIGLGTMGANLGMNLMEHGFAVAGADRDQAKAEAFRTQAQAEFGEKVRVGSFTAAPAMLNALKRPRAVLLLVPAGSIVDDVLRELRPLLEAEDVIIDGGNSHFADTDRRARQFTFDGIHLLGMGISGGADGARHGPGMMPGGSRVAWERLRPMLEACATRFEGEPGVRWLGRAAAGHYVKMVHNGIEYGLMQLIAETYDLMDRGLGIAHDGAREVFERWSRSELNSFLIDITADILKVHDAMGDGFLLDKIRDAARQKGTGLWTSTEALELQVPTPIINSAVTVRALSDFATQRERASEMLGGPLTRGNVDRDQFLNELREALYGAMIMTYAEGLHLLHAGSDHHGYGIQLSQVLGIWRSGCIISGQLPAWLRAAYLRNPALHNPMFDERVAERLYRSQTSLRQVVRVAARWGCPTPALMAALSYYDGYRSAHLPTNLIQAQRDFFGSHTFERTDRDGTFHARWH